MTLAATINTSASASPQVTPLVPNTPSGGGGIGVSFSDVLGAVNPLQHIPVVSSIYRAVTGSSISPTSQIAGDTLYGAILGGPALAGAAFGLSSAVADVTVSQVTGQGGIASHVLATLGLSGSSAGSSSNTVTQLVPAPAGTAPPVTASALTPQQQAAVAAQLILHQNSDPVRTNAQYQRAQMLDAGNKLLVKMAV